jgi:hypothetical protein
MVHFADMTDEERIARLANRATEIRKLLFGSLLLAKDTWKDELSRKAEGLRILEAAEKAEEAFSEGVHPDKLKSLEHTFGVISQRSRSIFDLMSYLSEYRKHQSP